MKKLPSLNGLRAISIVIVILFHLTRFNLDLDQDMVLRIPFLNGRFGVNIFFVISGFLITSLLLNEEGKTGTIAVKDFYIRRVLRIFPAYLFLLFVYFLLQWAGIIEVPKKAWITAITYTKYLNYHADFYTSHAWSLSIEETFYLFWPIVFTLGGETRKNVALFLVMAVPFIRYYAYGSSEDWLSEQSLFIRIDSISTGCLCALYKDKILARLSRHWNTFFYGSIAGIFLLPWLAWLAEGTAFELPFIFFGVLTGTAANAMIGAIILYSVYGPQRIWYRVLNWKVLDYIGLLSYSLYLWQQLFVYKTSFWITHFPQNLMGVVAASLFSYFLIERPFLKLKRRFSGKQINLRRNLVQHAKGMEPEGWHNP